MPVDLAVLKRHGVSAGAYKKIFGAAATDYPKGIRKLVDTISARIKDGRQLNLKEWRAYNAVDLAYDTPFNQTTPTIVQHILSRRLDHDQTVEELKQWGLAEEDLFLQVPTPDGRSVPILNPPVFFQIFIPLVKAYTTIRLASIFNQRNNNPLLQYKPLKFTDRNQLLCEVITDMVKTPSTSYGYAAVLRQAIQQMLKYGIMLSFPREEWHVDRQLEDVDGFEQVVVQKEGIRYAVPHPTKIGYDLKYPLTSLNTDSGVEYAFFWEVLSYGEILDNPLYWNRRSIFCGTNWFLSPYAGNYFTEVYPCSMKFPIGMFTPEQRDDRAAWYSSGDRDKSVFVTEMFMKLTPKYWGLADYKYPVWHRFTVAGDDTIIWAAPCAYTPSWFMGYDYDENSARTSSLSLEIIPWQDHLGNILSQMLLTAKQNLMNIIWYDVNQVDKEDIRRLENLGESRYRATQFLPFDSLKTKVAGLGGIQNAFVPTQFTKQNMAELLQLIPTVLQIMERVLQITAQEAGSAGPHQQSKAEILQTGGASTNRVQLTCSAVDEGIDAWMRQQYEANLAYRDPSFVAEVSADIPNVEGLLQELGFNISHQGKDKLLVHVQKAKLRLDGFASTSEGSQVGKDPETAQVIWQVVGTLSGQPELAKAVGDKNLLTLIELAATIAGAPRGFRLKNAQAEDQQEIPPNVLQAIQQSQQAVMQVVEQKVAQPIAQEMAGDKQQIDTLNQTVAKLSRIYEIASQLVDKKNIKAQESAAKAQLKAAELQSSESRKNASAQAEQRRREQKHQQELRQETEQAKVEQAIELAKADTDLTLKRVKASKSDTSPNS